MCPCVIFDLSYSNYFKQTKNITDEKLLYLDVCDLSTRGQYNLDILWGVELFILELFFLEKLSAQPT